MIKRNTPLFPPPCPPESPLIVEFLASPEFCKLLMRWTISSSKSRYGTKPCAG